MLSNISLQTMQLSSSIGFSCATNSSSLAHTRPSNAVVTKLDTSPVSNVKNPTLAESKQMLGGCRQLHTCFRGFGNGVIFYSLTRLLSWLEGRNARKGVLGTRQSGTILIVSSSRCIEGIQPQSMLLGQLDIDIRVNWSSYTDLARTAHSHKWIILGRYLNYIYRAS